MRYVLRTLPGYLALADTEGEDGRLVLIAGQAVVALPDAAFWALLKAPRPRHSPSIYADMVTENPARMARVEANGVGRLRSEKAILTRSGLTIATAHTRAPDPGTTIGD